MKIGVSLSPEILVGNPTVAEEQLLLRAFNGTAGLLSELKSRGVTHIEIRVVKPEYDLYMVTKAATSVWSAGLKLSIHGKLVDGDECTCFESFYPSLKNILQEFENYQRELNIVVHAYTSPEKSVEDLARMSLSTLNKWESILNNESVKFAVEINRIKENRHDPCSSYEGVLSTVNELNNSRFGICWDMGHAYYNVLNGLMPDDIPQRFLYRVIHTHIHGLGEKGTHCTLSPDGSLPLFEYLSKLSSSGYKGIYNLEFSFEKFPQDRLVTEFFDSIEKLKSMLL